MPLMPPEDAFDKRKGEYAPTAVDDSVMCENPVPVKYNQFDETGIAAQQNDMRLAIELARKRRAKRKCAYCRDHKTFCILMSIAVIVVVIFLIAVGVAYAVGLLWPEEDLDPSPNATMSDQRGGMFDDEHSIHNTRRDPFDFANLNSTNISMFDEDLLNQNSSDVITLPAVIIDVETSTLSRKTRCPMPTYSCDKKQTIVPLYRLCDGEFDCRDGSDELNCKQCRTSFKCKSLIANFSMCFRGNRLCDGKIDCHDFADEKRYCRADCRKNEYKCKNANVCVPKRYVCDGDQHCPNGDDEAECPTLQTLILNSDFFISCCNNGALWCKYSKKCLSMNAWCDYKERCSRR